MLFVLRVRSPALTNGRRLFSQGDGVRLVLFFRKGGGIGAANGMVCSPLVYMSKLSTVVTMTTHRLTQLTRARMTRDGEIKQNKRIRADPGYGSGSN